MDDVALEQIGVYKGSEEAFRKDCCGNLLFGLILNVWLRYPAVSRTRCFRNARLKCSFLRR
jgi:hypothetical protein